MICAYRPGLKASAQAPQNTYPIKKLDRVVSRHHHHLVFVHFKDFGDRSLFGGRLTRQFVVVMSFLSLRDSQAWWAFNMVTCVSKGRATVAVPSGITGRFETRSECPDRSSLLGCSGEYSGKEVKLTSYTESAF